MTQMHAVEEPDGDHRRAFVGRGRRSNPSTIRMRTRVSRTSPRPGSSRWSPIDAAGATVDPMRRVRAHVAMAVLLCLPCRLVRVADGTAPPPVTSVLTTTPSRSDRSTSPRARCWPRSTRRSLEARGFQVQRQLDVGPRELLIPALQRGLVELVPEYAGSLLGFFGGTASSDPATTHHERLAVALAPRGLTALSAAPAEDTNAFAISATVADGLHVRSAERPPFVRAGADVRRAARVPGPPVVPQGVGRCLRPALQGVRPARHRGPTHGSGAERRDDRRRPALLERPDASSGRADRPPRRSFAPTGGERHARHLAGNARAVRLGDRRPVERRISAAADRGPPGAERGDRPRAARSPRSPATGSGRTGSRFHRSRVGRSRRTMDATSPAKNPIEVEHRPAPASVPPEAPAERRASSPAAQARPDGQVLAGHGRVLLRDGDRRADVPDVREVLRTLGHRTAAMDRRDPDPMAHERDASRSTCSPRAGRSASCDGSAGSR